MSAHKWVSDSLTSECIRAGSVGCMGKIDQSRSQFQEECALQSDGERVFLLFLPMWRPTRRYGRPTRRQCVGRHTTDALFESDSLPSRVWAFKLNYEHTPVLISEIAKSHGLSAQRLYEVNAFSIVRNGWLWKELPITTLNFWMLSIAVGGSIKSAGTLSSVLKFAASVNYFSLEWLFWMGIVLVLVTIVIQSKS